MEMEHKMDEDARMLHVISVTHPVVDHLLTFVQADLLALNLPLLLFGRRRKSWKWSIRRMKMQSCQPFYPLILYQTAENAVILSIISVILC